MSTKKVIAGLMLFVLFIAGCSLKQEKIISIIPKPFDMEFIDGEFIITPKTKIFIEQPTEEIKRMGEYLAQLINETTGFYLSVEDYSKLKTDNTAAHILITTTDADKNCGIEGYSLLVTPNSIKLKALTAAGLFYGVQTIRQLLPVRINNSDLAVQDITWSIPCAQIKDKPRYTWRGMHLDVCRHFMPKEFILKYIDYLAMHKMNTFHWHLTEDQGWRIEIKKYPKLTEIGAWRDETVVGHNDNVPREFDGIRHGGFYTQAEIKEIVKYAQLRYVKIIPEIEMPGHSVAALSAYPEISCTEGPFKVRTFWGISDDVYCAGKEKTFEFLENVLAEVIELFPAEYIHIGGDECPKTKWKECPDCQARIKAEKLEDEFELQSYFIKRIEKFLIAKGRKLIGWDEILEGGLAPEATVMSWRGNEGGIEAARQGHDVVMSPYSHCYFDYYQGDPDNEPLAIGGFITLEKVYSFEPTPKELAEEEAKHILGAQGNVWTEYMGNPEQVEYMVFPRISALAEVVWSPAKNRNWDDFTKRMEKQYQRFEQLGINYSKSALSVQP